MIIRFTLLRYNSRRFVNDSYSPKQVFRAAYSFEIEAMKSENDKLFSKVSIAII